MIADCLLQLCRPGFPFVNSKLRLFMKVRPRHLRSAAGDEEVRLVERARSLEVTVYGMVGLFLVEVL